MTVTTQLWKLEELDAGIERDKQTLADDKTQLGDRRVLDTAAAKLAAARQQLGDLQRQHRAAEADVDDIISKINGDESKLYGGAITNPKDLSSLQHEIALMKIRSDELENKALAVIEKTEAAEQAVAVATAAGEKLEKAWNARQEQLAAEIAKLTASLAGLKKRRQELAGQIEPATLTLYERIRKQKKPAVSRVERGICQACRISPSSSALQHARAGQAAQCSCGRILYMS